MFRHILIFLWDQKILQSLTFGLSCFLICLFYDDSLWIETCSYISVTFFFWNRTVVDWRVLSLFCVKNVNTDNDSDSEQVYNFLPWAVTTWRTRDHVATLVLLHIHSWYDVICLEYMLLEIRYREWRKGTWHGVFVVKHRISSEFCTTLCLISKQRVKLRWKWKTMIIDNIWQISCKLYLCNPIMMIIIIIQ
jgi:hypothetical protein